MTMAINNFDPNIYKPVQGAGSLGAGQAGVNGAYGAQGVSQPRGVESVDQNKNLERIASGEKYSSLSMLDKMALLEARQTGDKDTENKIMERVEAVQTTQTVKSPQETSNSTNPFAFRVKSVWAFWVQFNVPKSTMDAINALDIKDGRPPKTSANFDSYQIQDMYKFGNLTLQ